jgi:16S rRNA (guanine527-N7)-methyltransferase
VGKDKAHREQYNVAVCRAMGPMTEVLECTLPLIQVGGVLLAMKGPKAEEELRDAGDAIMILGGGELEVYGAYPDSFGQNTVIVSLQKQEPTPREYPRAPGLARQSPL